jgi:hypothetical protein
MATTTTIEDQVSAAVQALIPTTVSYPYGQAGTRDVGSSFYDFQSAAIGCFLTNDGAVYYVIKLARDRLLTVTSALKTTLQALMTACTDSVRNVQPVVKTATLTNAKAALDQLATAMQQRTGVYQAIVNVPSFQRYSQNINQFLSDEGSKTVARGNLVDPPQTARAKLPSGAVQLQSQWSDMLNRVTFWANAMDNYGALNLPSALTATIMQSASNTLASQISQLNALNPDDRLLVLRDLVVSLVANQTVVSTFGSLETPTVFVPITGSGSVYSDTSHLAVPASFSSDFFEGYSVYPGHSILNLQVDGAYNLALTLPGSFVARIDCLGRGPFALTHTSFRINAIENQNDHLVYHPNDINLSALPNPADPWLVQQAINAQATTAVSHLFHQIAKFQQEVSTTITSPTTMDFTLLAPTTWSYLGAVSGDTIIITQSGSSSQDSIWDITSVVGNVASATLRPGTGVGINSFQTLVSVGTDANIRFYIQLAITTVSLAHRTTLQLQDLDAGTLAQFSLFSGMQIDSVRTSASTIAKAVNQGTMASVNGVPRLAATTEFVATFHTGNARTNTTDPTLFTFYDVREEATLTSTATFTSLFDNKDIAALGVGAVVVVRESNVAVDINLYGTIQSVVGTTFTVNFLVTGTGSFLLEAAKANYFPLSNLRTELMIVVGENTVFDGSYLSSTKPPPTPLDIYLTTALTGYIGQGGQPVFLNSVQIGQQRVALQSLDSTLASSILVVGTGDFDSAFTSGPYPKLVPGTTSWVQLPSTPTGLNVGDILEVYQTDRSVPSVGQPILAINANNFIQLAEPIPNNLPALVFDVTNVLPFARIRKTTHQNFLTVSTQVQTWLQLPVNNMLSTFRSLTAAINPLIANTNPSLPQAVAAQQQLNAMLNAILALEGYLNAYDADPVTDIDSLVKGFLQKGLDRAVDVLLAADFTDFFGLDMESGSYAGNLQKNLRNVQKQDLPVRKDNRVHSRFAAQEQIIAQTGDVDYGYVQDPVDPVQNGINNTEQSSPNIRNI